MFNFERERTRTTDDFRFGGAVNRSRIRSSSRSLRRTTGSTLTRRVDSSPRLPSTKSRTGNEASTSRLDERLSSSLPLSSLSLSSLPSFELTSAILSLFPPSASSTSPLSTSTQRRTCLESQSSNLPARLVTPFSLSRSLTVVLPLSLSQPALYLWRHDRQYPQSRDQGQLPSLLF